MEEVHEMIAVYITVSFPARTYHLRLYIIYIYIIIINYIYGGVVGVSPTRTSNNTSVGSWPSIHALPQRPILLALMLEIGGEHRWTLQHTWHDYPED